MQFADGMAAAHRVYLKQRDLQRTDSVVVVMVVQVMTDD